MIKGMKNVVVYVSDFQKAATFYKERLGLPLIQEAQTMMEFFPGSPTTLGVALAMHEDARKLVGRPTGITLTVGDIDRFCKALSAQGVQFDSPLEATPWGKWAVVKDPDGNLFALVEGK